MKKLKLLMASLVIVIGLGAAVPAMASAASGSSSAADRNISDSSGAESAKQTVCGALEAGSDCKQNSNGVNVNNLVKTIVNILSWVVGVVAVIMIIIGGFKYITSNGDSNAISSAKNTILYAVVGLVVVAFAQSIVWFVLNKI